MKEILLSVLENLLVTAIEGGIGYWAEFSSVEMTKVREATTKDKNVSFSEKLFVYLKDVEDAKFDVNDCENPEDVLGTLTLASCETALLKMATSKEYAHRYGNIISENYDAEDADVFFQLASMNDVVFG